MQKFDFSKFGNPLSVVPNGKQLPVTPNGLKGKVKFVSLDPRAFKLPKDWVILNVSLKDQYDSNGNKTGATYYRVGLLNGAVARPLLQSGVDLSSVSIMPVTADCKPGVDLSQFKQGDFVHTVKPLLMLQWIQQGNSGNYGGVRLAIQNLKKEEGHQNG